MPAEQHLTQEGPAFTTRSLLLGCLCVFGVSAGATYGTLYLKGSFMALGTSMPGAVFLLFLLTFLINPLLKLVHPPLGLRPRSGRQGAILSWYRAPIVCGWGRNFPGAGGRCSG